MDHFSKTQHKRSFHWHMVEILRPVLLLICPSLRPKTFYISFTRISSLYFMAIATCKSPVKRRSASILHDTRCATPKRVTSGGIHLRGLAPGRHSSEETSQWWRAGGDMASDLTGPGTEPKASHTDSFNHYAKFKIGKTHGRARHLRNREIKSIKPKSALCSLSFLFFAYHDAHLKSCDVTKLMEEETQSCVA